MKYLSVEIRIRKMWKVRYEEVWSFEFRVSGRLQFAGLCLSFEILGLGLGLGLGFNIRLLDCSIVQGFGFQYSIVQGFEFRAVGFGV